MRMTPTHTRMWNNMLRAKAVPITAGEAREGGREEGYVRYVRRNACVIMGKDIEVRGEALNTEHHIERKGGAKE